MHLTGRFPLLLAAGVVPVVALSIAGVDPWLTLGGWLVLCLAAAGVDAAVAADPRRVHVDRTVPRRALRDSRVHTTLTLRGPQQLHGQLRDAWQPTAGAPHARAVVHLEADVPLRIDVPLQPRRRGELVSEFVVLRSVGPLGLAGRQSRLNVRGAVRVLPPFTARRHLPSRLARLRELDGATSVLVRGQGSEFDSLRPYVRGDDVRSIDWRATARAGTTMLRTWRPERDRHIVIVIDTGRTSAARVGDGVRLDAEMEATLLLAALAVQAGDHVHLVMADRAVRARVSGVDGEKLLPALVDAMAPIEPTLIDTDWDAVAAHVRSLTVRPSLIVLLTAQDEATAARGFLGTLPGFIARAHVLIGTVTDTGLAAQARARATAGEIFRAAAAEQTLSDADRVIQAVVAAGADALTDGPEELPPRIADRYLQLKAAGRL
ncbi:DUF58 domain-containing protein [Microbacterium horticulturae]|uniref:DUF58 domain-containing protein n=1 Tax=Microbacterium horticulturae TaxID=3028316 RepID=A0ABY8BZ52_9MICO|nr:DUF58 domain-containing protein [Microbacterium sp. KACC 23027]WEG07873.1 DUF58 domain-containing protein [Microbacterium sp. KACC 23027]